MSVGNLLAVLGSIAGGGVLSAGIYSRYGQDNCDFIGSGFTKSGGNISAQEAGVYYIRQFVNPGGGAITKSSITIDSMEFLGSDTLDPMEFIVELGAGDTISAYTTVQNSASKATTFVNVARVS